MMKGYIYMYIYTQQIIFIHVHVVFLYFHQAYMYIMKLISEINLHFKLLIKVYYIKSLFLNLFLNIKICYFLPFF
jgi:hypothetical protein